MTRNCLKLIQFSVRNSGEEQMLTVRKTKVFNAEIFVKVNEKMIYESEEKQQKTYDRQWSRTSCHYIKSGHAKKKYRYQFFS